MAPRSLKKLSTLSAYARAESHLVQYTYHGALVTILGVLTAIILFAAELRHYTTPHEVQTMSVDMNKNMFLRVHFNMTFHALPCHVLHLDAVDVSGTQQGDMSYALNGQIHKYRLDPNGERIGLGEFVTPHRGPGNSLFFMRRPRHEIEMLNKAVDAHEGCILEGWLDLRKVAGNFKISIHMDDYFMLRKTQQDIAAAVREQLAHLGERNHQMGVDPHVIPTDTTSVNVSHTIHKMSFGNPYPGKVDPLEGFQRIVDHDSGIFKYFIKIVPTSYVGKGHAVMSNQYSLTEYYHAVKKHEVELPSVIFLYDFSPITVQISVKRRSLLHLLVRFCAVVGGVFAVTGLLDGWVHRAVTFATATTNGRR